MFLLITSITHHELAPAAELATLYEQRWEFEISLDDWQYTRSRARAYCADDCPTWSNKKCGPYCSPPTPFETSFATLPRRGHRPPTDCPSSEASESSAARSPTRRVFLNDSRPQSLTHSTKSSPDPTPNDTYEVTSVAKRKMIGTEIIKRSHHRASCTPNDPPCNSSGNPLNLPALWSTATAGHRQNEVSP